jgi:hypothetical protein
MRTRGRSRPAHWVGRERYTIESKDPLPAGKATVKFEFKYDGGGLGKGGTGTIDKITMAVTPAPAAVQKEEERQEAVIDEGIN